MALKEDLDAIKEKFRTSKYECNYCLTFSLGSVRSFGCLPAQSKSENIEQTNNIWIEECSEPRTQRLDKSKVNVIYSCLLLYLLRSRDTGLGGPVVACIYISKIL